MMKEIKVFTVEAYAEEEDYRVHFVPKEGQEHSKEKFEKDVRESIVKILNEKYTWVKLDDTTFVRKRAVDRPEIKQFIDCLRNKIKYDGTVYIDSDGCIKYYLDDDELMGFGALENCYKCSFPMFFGSRILPSKIIESEEFEDEMDRRGWEKVSIYSEHLVDFYEYGGFVLGSDGKWYNHVWNSGYYDVLTGEKYENIKSVGDNDDSGDE